MACRNLKETSEMAQQLKVLGGKPDNLSSIPETQMVKKGRQALINCPLISAYVPWHFVPTYTHMYAHNI